MLFKLQVPFWWSPSQASYTNQLQALPRELPCLFGRLTGINFHARARSRSSKDGDHSPPQDEQMAGSTDRTLLSLLLPQLRRSFLAQVLPVHATSRRNRIIRDISRVRLWERYRECNLTDDFQKTAMILPLESEGNVVAILLYTGMLRAGHKRA